jgi:hypothetical protein
MRPKILYFLFFIVFLSAVPEYSLAAFPIKEQQKQESGLPKLYHKVNEASVRNTGRYLNQVNPAGDHEEFEKRDSGIFGSLALAFGLTGIFPAAIVLGIIGMQRHRKDRGLAIAGLVLGILTIFFIAAMFLVIIYLN